MRRSHPAAGRMLFSLFGDYAATAARRVGCGWGWGRRIECLSRRGKCWDAVWSACGSVGSTGPTVLPIRKEPLALAYDPLDNRKIAFGVVRFALRRFP